MSDIKRMVERFVICYFNKDTGKYVHYVELVVWIENILKATHYKTVKLAEESAKELTENGITIHVEIKKIYTIYTTNE